MPEITNEDLAFEMAKAEKPFRDEIHDILNTDTFFAKVIKKILLTRGKLSELDIEAERASYLVEKEYKDKEKYNEIYLYDQEQMKRAGYQPPDRISEDILLESDGFGRVVYDLYPRIIIKEPNDPAKKEYYLARGGSGGDSDAVKLSPKEVSEILFGDAEVTSKVLSRFLQHYYSTVIHPIARSWVENFRKGNLPNSDKSPEVYQYEQELINELSNNLSRAPMSIITDIL